MGGVGQEGLPLGIRRLLLLGVMVVRRGIGCAPPLILHLHGSRAAGGVHGWGVLLGGVVPLLRGLRPIPPLLEGATVLLRVLLRRGVLRVVLLLPSSLILLLRLLCGVRLLIMLVVIVLLVLLPQRCLLLRSHAGVLVLGQVLHGSYPPTARPTPEVSRGVPQTHRRASTHVDVL